MIFTTLQDNMKTGESRLEITTMLFVFLAIYSVTALEKYSLDNSTSNKCGEMLKIHPDEEIVLTSSGRAPKGLGFCSTVVYAVGKSDQKCHGMCMSVSSQFMDVCHAKIQFKGMDFGQDDDPFRELSCFHRLPSEWCFDTKAMSVEVVETYFYANEMSALSYNFTVKVSPLCDNSPFGKAIEAREAERRKSDADARNRARIHGILVGVCLAIMFLIALLITWCYYKNKPFRRDIHNYPTATVRKRPTFAGLKAKMTFHHKASGSEEGEAKSKREKKHSHSKDEATTENEETKPKKRGLRFLNKLRSNKAEEVPLVEKKDDKSEDVEEKLEEIKDENVDNKSDKDKGENNDESTEAEKEDSKQEIAEDPVKEEKVGEETESENVVTSDKSSNEPATNIETPSVTVTTPGDNENGSKNDSSDDS